MSFTDDEVERYARHLVLREVGGQGQQRLKAASVLIVGAGGLGAPAALYLAAAGVGRIVLADADVVDTSNLQRQVIFRDGDLGVGKVDAAAAAVRALNPNVHADPRPARIDAANAADLIAGADVVLDGCDNFATRLAVADAALTAGIPLVSAAVGQFEGQLGVFRGWESGKPCYRCFVGDAPDREEANCAEQGVLGPVTGVLGSLAALEAVRAVAPFGDDPAGRLLLLDLLSWRFRSVSLPKDPACRCRPRR